MNSQKINERNWHPTSKSRYPVYSEQYNELFDDVSTLDGFVSNNKDNVVTLTDSVTLDTTTYPSGTVFLINMSADDKVVTLPATVAGVKYTFINIMSTAGHNYRIDPNASDKIVGKVIKPEGSNADATTANGLVSVLDGADGKYIELTKASSDPGDRISLLGDGNDGWYVTEGLGIYTHE